MKPNWYQNFMYGTIIGMEGCWLYILFIMLNELVVNGRLSVAGLLLLYPVALGLNGLLRWLGWPGALQNILNVILWAASVLLMIKFQLFSHVPLSDTAWLLALPRAAAGIFRSFEPELLILAASAAAWWLGRRLARIRLNFSTSILEFQFGLSVLLITLFLGSGLGARLASAVPVVLSFVLFALLGISIAHAQEGGNWITRAYQSRWSGLLLVSISLILIIGLLIGAVLTPEVLQLIWNAVKWVWHVIERGIMFLLSLLPVPDAAEAPPPEWTVPTVEPPEDGGAFVVPEDIRNVFRLLWNILAGGLVVLFLWRASSQIFGWLRRRLADTSGTEFEPLRGAFRADILRFLRHILDKLVNLRLPFRRQRRTEPPEIISVRQLYRQFLHWAAARVQPRLASQTPHEYLYVLEESIPESGDALHLITRYYVSARYGLYPASEEELHRLRQSWHQVRHSRPRPRIAK